MSMGLSLVRWVRRQIVGIIGFLAWLVAVYDKADTVLGVPEFPGKLANAGTVLERVASAAPAWAWSAFAWSIILGVPLVWVAAHWSNLSRLHLPRLPWSAVLFSRSLGPIGMVQDGLKAHIWPPPGDGGVPTPEPYIAITTWPKTTLEARFGLTVMDARPGGGPAMDVRGGRLSLRVGQNPSKRRAILEMPLIHDDGASPLRLRVGAGASASASTVRTETQGVGPPASDVGELVLVLDVEGRRRPLEWRLCWTPDATGSSHSHTSQPPK